MKLIITILLSTLLLNHAWSDEEIPPELAGFMGELQRFTHKLVLATEAQNQELANFYLYESLTMLMEIQLKLPEYKGLPIGDYIDRFALPAYKPLQSLFISGDLDKEKLKLATDDIIDSCNSCHNATRFQFIKIRRNSHNPYLQDFSPNTQ